jgi:archaellum component FlaC
MVRAESAERPYNNSNIRREDSERLRAIEKELSRAREMYNGVIGITGRIRWKKEVELLEIQFHDLMSRLGELAPELRKKDNSHEN